MIGEKHCLALDAQFFANALPRHGFMFAFYSSPFEMKSTFFNSSQRALSDFPVEELLVVAKPITKPPNRTNPEIL